MGQVLDLRRLRAAYEAVRSNRGEPGVDEAFGEQLEVNLAALVVELRGKTYRPQPVRRGRVSKPDWGARPPGIRRGHEGAAQRAGCCNLGRILVGRFSS